MRSPLLLAALALGILFSCGGSDSGGTDQDAGDDGNPIGPNDGGGGDGTLTDTGPPPPTPSPFGLDTRPSNTTCVAQPRPPSNTGVDLQRMWPGVTFNAPIYMVQAPGDANNWYVVERGGTVKLVPLTAATDADVKTVVQIAVNQGGEGGLLGLAFDPAWQTSHTAYLSYTRDAIGGDPPPPANCNVGTSVFTSAIGRFKSADNGKTFTTPADEILLIGQPYTNHNGGNIQFGPDGFLYIAFGDGGSGGDPCGDGQRLDVKFGKFLRIDVNAPAGMYNIPPDNPFVNTTGADKAIWSYGHRNPWRWSFDKDTGDLWLGEVGQDVWEEVDHVQKGGNYGWNKCEGFHQEGQQALCGTPGLIDPLIDYQHGNDGNCVIGGYVYRGATPGLSSLVGTYLFGDNGSGNIWTLTYDQNNKAQKTPVANVPGGSLVSFAQGLDGETYVVRQDGQIQKFIPAGGEVVPDIFPKLLSQTGCVDPKDATKPASGVIPYDVISPLWSDGAQKGRWLGIPDGKKITIGGDGDGGTVAGDAGIGAEMDWDLPIGSVAMKLFTVNGKRTETRLFMRHADGGWAGYSYEWNDQGTDATLLPAGKSKSVGTQTWSYPSRTQCIQCHSQAAGGTIGLETWQLNRDTVYPSTNRISNELATLDHIGMFTQPLGAAPSALPKLPDPAGTDPLEARARSYMHSNCSHCHRPAGGGQGTMDLRFGESLKDTVTCNADTTQGAFEGATKIIFPADPTKSVLSLRVHSNDAKRMPPVAVSLLDPTGSKLLDDWITSLTTCP